MTTDNTLNQSATDQRRSRSYQSHREKPTGWFISMRYLLEDQAKKWGVGTVLLAVLGWWVAGVLEKQIDVGPEVRALRVDVQEANKRLDTLTDAIRQNTSAMKRGGK